MIVMSLFKECAAILAERYGVEGDSYTAGGEIFSLLGRHLITVSLPMGQAMPRFFLHGKTAFYGSVVVYRDGPQKRRNVVVDTMKTCTTLKVGACLVRGFFSHNKGQFADYTLAISIGNLSHDMAMFIQKCKTGGYRVVHYDPNIRTRSLVADTFLKELKGCQWRCGYHSPDGNVVGMCTALAWTELLEFIVNGVNPFEKRLLTYNRTTRLYNNTNI